MALVAVLLAVGFVATVWISYLVSKENIHDLIVDHELPLTSDTVYSEIQKDLVRPIFISSMMASDTFLRDWVLRGERDTAAIAKYLNEIKARYGAVTSFFVSDRTGNYYHPTGVARQVKADDPRESWYFRVRAMAAPYEINVDADQNNQDAMTIFINFRVHDYDQRFLGVAGVGLTVDTVQRLVAQYQKRYQRIIYFVDKEGRIALPGSGPAVQRIDQVEGLRQIADRVLAAESGSYQYESDRRNHLLNVRYVTELHWHLFVEKIEDDELTDIRRTLVLNLALCAAITMAVLLAIHLFISRQQRQAQQTREDTLRFFSHDLRAPLASIVTLADGARETPCPALLDRASHYAQNALHLTDGLVQLMRAEAVDRRHFATLDLAEVIRDAADQTWAAASARDIQVRQEVGDEALVSGDRTLLTRAMTNLLDNAIKFSPAGSVVTLSLRRAGEHWIASVADQGPGIPAQRLAQIFLPYHRGQPADPRAPGVGLGLAIVKAVAESHGGAVEAVSVPNQGATFSLRLPAIS
jgi:signal transduction histidine kinase